MKLKLVCKNKHYIEVEEYLFVENPREYTRCNICGEILFVVNTDEVIAKDLEEQVKINVDNWFMEMGIEATLEFIERCKSWIPKKIYNLYRKEIKSRGLT